MKICHSSDLHGCQYKIPVLNSDFTTSDQKISIFPKIKEDFDIFVMSGDFLPNKIWGPNKKKADLKIEKKYQEYWVETNAKGIKEMIKDKPFLFSSGNHDFINPCEILIKHGVNAIDLDNKVVDFMGYTFYGFPYIPAMDQNWNFERDSQEMRNEVINMIDRLKTAKKFDSLDILVAHCPLYGILDRVYAENIGNTHMNTFLEYQLPKLPKAYFCGHDHQCGGNYAYFSRGTEADTMFISNAATKIRIYDLDNLPLDV